MSGLGRGIVPPGPAAIIYSAIIHCWAYNARAQFSLFSGFALYAFRGLFGLIIIAPHSTLDSRRFICFIIHAIAPPFHCYYVSIALLFYNSAGPGSTLFIHHSPRCRSCIISFILLLLRVYIIIISPQLLLLAITLLHYLLIQPPFSRLAYYARRRAATSRLFQLASIRARIIFCRHLPLVIFARLRYGLYLLIIYNIGAAAIAINIPLHSFNCV